MIKVIKDKLIRRLDVHLVSHIGAPESSTDWVNGYQQAINDVKKFLTQLEVYEPYTECDSQN
jgi:hypothetical protein